LELGRASRARAATLRRVSVNAAALRTYYFLSISAMGVFLPFLPAWLDARGVSGWGIGIIAATRPLAGILVPVVFGVLADVLRLRGSLLRVACLGAVAAMVLTTLSVGLANPGVVWLAVLFGVMALFRAPMNSLADVMALEMHLPFGRLRLWGSLGFMTAALLSGYLVDPTLPVPLPATMTVLLVAATVMAFVLPPRAHVPPRPVWSAARGLFSSSDHQLFLLAVFLWGASHCAYDLSITLHLGALGASNGFIGWAWAIGTFAEVGLMASCAGWIDRHGPARMMLLGVVIAAVRWVLIATIRSPEVLLLLQPLHAGSFALVFVAAASWVKERAEPHVIATAQASFAVAMSLGAGLGMLTWGPLLDLAGAPTVFVGGAIAALGSAVTLIGLIATQRAPSRATG
jgi:PPP family 3-phenylpropionic acid transporter